MIDIYIFVNLAAYIATGFRWYACGRNCWCMCVCVNGGLRGRDDIGGYYNDLFWSL